MEDYSFWADLLASYRASSDIIKALWLLVPLLFAAGFLALAVGAALLLTERRGRTFEPSFPAREEEKSEYEWHTAAAIEHDTADTPKVRLPRR